MDARNSTVSECDTFFFLWFFSRSIWIFFGSQIFIVLRFLSLESIDPPTIRLHGAPQIDLEEGKDSLVLRCEADANPPASIVWKRAGRSEIASLQVSTTLIDFSFSILSFAFVALHVHLSIPVSCTYDYDLFNANIGFSMENPKWKTENSISIQKQHFPNAWNIQYTNSVYTIPLICTTHCKSKA